MLYGGQTEFLYFIASAGALLGIFCISAIAILTILYSLNPQDEDFGWMATLSVGLGPASLGWLFTLALRYLPGYEPQSYVIGAAVICALIAIVRLRHLYRLTIKTLRAHFRQYDSYIIRFIAFSMTIPIMLILLGLLLISSFLPMTGNDPLEYAQAARLLANASSVDLYPFVDSS